ncbi:MAG: Gfo/Idh/MocA family oxidoreductase [Clostridia bacterium]|nr:Gfo/Idh/MocA family oxidoreductase [Clostridia bacterium]
MVRIGILGTENTHANKFAEFINRPQEDGSFRYPDCKVTCVYGLYPESNEKIAKESGIECIAGSIDEMLGKVDAVMVTARDGIYHYPFAKKFLEKGMPAFIDKPFTVSPEEATELISLAKEKGALLNGGSSLKFSKDIIRLKELAQNNEVLNGAVFAPIRLYSEYSGFYFYASHLVEMTLEIFGYNPKSVTAERHEKSVTATINYDTFSVTNHFSERIDKYAVGICTQEGVELCNLDLSDCAIGECDAFVEMLRCGKMYNTYEQLIIPVFYMNAVEKAYTSGEKVKIEFGE